MKPSISHWPQPRPDATRDHDHDSGAIKPAAWKHVKKALGGHPANDRLFKAMEDVAGNGCVRLVLFAAMLRFAELPAEERTDSLIHFVNWSHDEWHAAQAMEQFATDDPEPVALPRNAA